LYWPIYQKSLSSGGSHVDESASTKTSDSRKNTFLPKYLADSDKNSNKAPVFDSAVRSAIATTLCLPTLDLSAPCDEQRDYDTESMFSVPIEPVFTRSYHDRSSPYHDKSSPYHDNFFSRMSGALTSINPGKKEPSNSNQKQRNNDKNEIKRSKSSLLGRISDFEKAPTNEGHGHLDEIFETRCSTALNEDHPSHHPHHLQAIAETPTKKSMFNNSNYYKSPSKSTEKRVKGHFYDSKPYADHTMEHNDGSPTKRYHDVAIDPNDNSSFNSSHQHSSRTGVFLKKKKRNRKNKVSSTTDMTSQPHVTSSQQPMTQQFPRNHR
jgi:hypothetical protein